MRDDFRLERYNVGRDEAARTIEQIDTGYTFHRSVATGPYMDVTPERRTDQERTVEMMDRLISEQDYT